MAIEWPVLTRRRTSSGERLAASVGRVGYLAREIARELPAVFGEVEA